jgi:glycosyltransferase involved in cell wall biosynthesis
VRVLVVTTHFPPYASGGAHLVDFIRYVRELVNAGYRVTVVCGWSSNGTNVERNSFETFRVHFPNLPPRAVWFQLENRKLILDLVKGADVVLSYQASIGLLASAIAARRIPLIVKNGGSPVTGAQRYLELPFKFQNIRQTAHFLGELPVYYYLTRAELIHSTHLVFDSYQALKNVEYQFGVKISQKSTVIHSRGGVLFDGVSAAKDQTNNIVFAGRLYATKGIQDLVEAFIKLSPEESFASWKLVVLGDGPIRKALEARVSNGGLGDRITFLGTVSQARVLEEELRARIFVHPSYNESNSNAVAEAMALGLPIVVPHLSWAVEQTADYPNKTFFSIGDADDLAQKLKAVILAGAARQPISLNTHDQTIVDVIETVGGGIMS